MIVGIHGPFEVVDADANKGAFLSPLLLMNEKPFASTTVHETEAFGPVSTIMPYKNMDDAIALSKMGRGSLCTSIVTANDNIAKQYVLDAGTHHGRFPTWNSESDSER